MVYFQFGAIINELYVKTIVQVFCECMVSFFLVAYKERSCQVILSCMKKLYEDFFHNGNITLCSYRNQAFFPVLVFCFCYNNLPLPQGSEDNKPLL